MIAGFDVIIYNGSLKHRNLPGYYIKQTMYMIFQFQTTYSACRIKWSQIRNHRIDYLGAQWIRVAKFPLQG